MVPFINTNSFMACQDSLCRLSVAVRFRGEWDKQDGLTFFTGLVLVPLNVAAQSQLSKMRHFKFWHWKFKIHQQILTLTKHWAATMRNETLFTWAFDQLCQIHLGVLGCCQLS